jgi:hypothetical protein
LYAGAQQQCALLQLTEDVLPGAGPTQWRLKVGTTSGFNKNLNELLVVDQTNPAPESTGPVDDWTPNLVNIAGASVVPLGRLRWSRYEIDYGVADVPYLVRRDIIGYQPGVDPGNLGSVQYPFCEPGKCPMPQLHLPGTNSPPAAVAVGPMVEDMQIAVGCDGYTAAAAALANTAGRRMVPPDVAPQSFAEKGPVSGPTANQPNLLVDENPVGNQREQDEWLGNATNEAWAPDCVWYGTGHYNAAQWGNIESHASPPGNFRMSPQTVRISLVGTSEVESPAGGSASVQVPALEDRVIMNSFVNGIRERFVLTERFSPPNLRWRDPFVP